MRPRRCLVVASNASRAQSVGAMLSGEGVECLAVASAGAAVRAAAAGGFSAALLDADEPAVKAALLCRRLRKRYPPASLAVVLFGRKPAPETLVSALDAGADDYWAWPLIPLVHLAYWRALLRRISAIERRAKPLRCGPLVVDPAGRRALVEGRSLRLRAKEFDLLYVMLARRGEALSREVLMGAVWGQEYFGTTRTVDFHVSQLRGKLGEARDLIETIPGTGYRLSAP